MPPPPNRALLLLAALVLALSLLADSGVVVPRAADFLVLNNKNVEKLVKLKANLEIPDNGDLSAEIIVNSLDGLPVVPVSHTSDVRDGTSQAANSDYTSRMVANPVVMNPYQHVKEDMNGVPVQQVGRKSFTTSSAVVSNELIFASSHGLSVGTAVVYTDHSSLSVDGLTDGTTYYVAAAVGGAPTRMKLAATAANAKASTPVTLAIAGGLAGNMVTVGLLVTISAVNSNELVFASSHGLSVGTAVVYTDHSGLPVGGLVSGTTYYVAAAAATDHTRMKLAATEADAKAAPPVTLTITGGLAGNMVAVVAKPFVAQDYKVKKVEVHVRGFFHEHAGDIKMELLHNDVAAVLVEGRQGEKPYGRPRPRSQSPSSVDPRGNLPSDYPAPYMRTQEHETMASIQGDGFDYTFKDLGDANLALNRPAKQSTTLYGGTAGKAVDGNTNSYYSGGSVTHTAGNAGDINEFPTTAEEGAPDPEAWWEVDLGEGGKEIGTIKLWNRQQEPTRDEVQRVTTRGSEQMGGTFQLRFRTASSLHTTEPIAVNAVARLRDEDGTSTAAGLGKGESMQSKLQALASIGTVDVERGAADSFGGYTWTVTFVSEPGNLLPLEPLDAGITTQGIVCHPTDPATCSPEPKVAVTTQTEGTANVWYNYKDMPLLKKDSLQNPYNLPNEAFVVTGKMVPCWVMILDEDIGDANLTVAKNASKWKKRIAEDSRETVIRLRGTLRGRYVRVQGEENSALSLAEVQIYKSNSKIVRDYRGGSPIIGGTYQPEQTLNELFAGTEATGSWVLRISDSTALTTARKDPSLPTYPVHGIGAFDDWQLAITDQKDVKRYYNMDLSVEIKTLPKYGKLYRYICTLGTCDTKGYRGDELEAVVGRQRHLSQCYGSCADQFGVGNLLSTNPDGSIAENNLVALDRQVIYRPPVDFLGSDSWTFVLRHGTVTSANVGTAHISTRICRHTDTCENDYFGDAPTYETHFYER